MNVQNMPVILYLVHGVLVFLSLYFVLLCLVCLLHFIVVISVFLCNYVCRLVLISMKILENTYKR